MDSFFVTLRNVALIVGAIVYAIRVNTIAEHHDYNWFTGGGYIAIIAIAGVVAIASEIVYYLL